MGAGRIVRQGPLEPRNDARPVRRPRQGHEIHHHQPADMAQPELPRDLVRRRQIGRQQVARSAGIDVDRGQRLGRLDDDRSAVGERDQDQVMAALKTAVADDPAQTYIVPMSPLGLIEMTRERRGPGLEISA